MNINTYDILHNITISSNSTNNILDVKGGGCTNGNGGGGTIGMDTDALDVDPNISEVTVIDPDISEVMKFDPNISEVLEVDPDISEVMKFDPNISGFPLGRFLEYSFRGFQKQMLQTLWRILETDLADIVWGTSQLEQTWQMGLGDLGTGVDIENNNLF